jgi:hypothetical protein
MELYKEALSLLMERSPQLALGAHAWGSLPLQEETHPQVEVDAVDTLYLYGVGTGSAYLQYVAWLKKDPKRNLVFLEDEPGHLTSFFHLRQAIAILKDPQVHFAINVDGLSEKFPSQKIEFISLPSKKKGKTLRLKLFRETALSYALRLDRLHGYQHAHNFFQNVHHLSRSFYANRLKNTFENIPAIICGAGPSLQSSISHLKTLEQKALLIAGGSSITALHAQGILPHFGVAIDPNKEEVHRLQHCLKGFPFLYSARVHREVCPHSEGPIGYMRSQIGGSLEEWIEGALSLTDAPIGEDLPVEMMSVTGVCIAWALFLGCNPIILNGIDLAYTEGKHYAPGVTQENQIRKDETTADLILTRKGKQGKRVKTAIRWVMESSSISELAKTKKETQFIDTTVDGLGFKGIHFQPLEEVSPSWQPQDLRLKIQQAIHKASMPSDAKQVIEQEVQKLQQSLDKVIASLQVLAGEKVGSKALAEIDLEEELAARVLFYDIYQLFASGPLFWKNWLELAHKYSAVISL